MVDFQRKDTTITTPPSELLKLAILDRRARFLNELEEYERSEHRGGYAAEHRYKAALYTLFMEIRSALLKDKKEKVEDWEEIARNPADFDAAIKLFRELDEWMYDKNLTKFDTKQKVEGRNIEEVNRSHDL